MGGRLTFIVPDNAVHCKDWVDLRETVQYVGVTLTWDKVFQIFPNAR
jgi:hypothetical protein